MKFRNKLILGIMFIGAFFARIEIDAFKTVIYVSEEQTLEGNFAFKNEDGETFLTLECVEILFPPRDEMAGMAMFRRPDGTGTFAADIYINNDQSLLLMNIYEFIDGKELCDIVVKKAAQLFIDSLKRHPCYYELKNERIRE